MANESTSNTVVHLPISVVGGESIAIMQNQFLPPKMPTGSLPAIAPSATSSETEAAQTSSTQAMSAQTTASERAVTNLLGQVQRQVRRRKRVFCIAYSVLGLVFLSIVGLSWVGNIAHNGRFQGLLDLLPALYITFIAVLALLIGFLHVAIAPNALTQVSSTQGIPVILDALAISIAGRSRNSLFRALTSLLPTMQAADAHLLTPSHRHTLNLWLATHLNLGYASEMGPDCVLAILKAYERVGDAKAVPIVERMATIHPHNEAQQELRQAAQECLVLMWARLGGVQPEHTLLRASMPANTPGILLRPATSETAALPHELLRAANSNDTPPAT